MSIHFYVLINLYRTGHKITIKNLKKKNYGEYLIFVLLSIYFLNVFFYLLFRLVIITKLFLSDGNNV